MGNENKTITDLERELHIARRMKEALKKGKMTVTIPEDNRIMPLFFYVDISGKEEDYNIVDKLLVEHQNRLIYSVDKEINNLHIAIDKLENNKPNEV